MQSLPFNVAAGSSATIQAQGRAVSFESGTSSTGNVYILITGTGQSQMRLKPGQRYSGTIESYSWTVVCEDSNAAISGHLVIGDGDFQDSAVNATIAGSVAVSNTPTVTVGNTNAQAVVTQIQALATLSNLAPVVLAVAGTVYPLISDATQRILRIFNANASGKIYLGGAGLTQANAAIVLNPGDMWIETEAAGAAWFACSDTAAVNVNLMGLKP